MKFFFAMNYLSFAVIWATQLLIVRLYGLESFGQYAVFLSLMAFVEGPLIAARSDSALTVLNKATNRGAFLSRAVYHDAVSALALAPVIVAVVYAIIGWEAAMMTLLAVLVQSGYAAAKSLFIVEKWRLQLTIGEFTIACIHVAFLLAALSIGSTVTVLIGVYLLYSLVKNLFLFVLIWMFQTPSADKKTDNYSAYKPLSSVLVVRNIALNSFNNLDVLILAAKAVPETLALYKIMKTVAGLLFRVITPLWRWKLFDMNEIKRDANEAVYRAEQVKAGGVALISLLAAVVSFIFAGEWFIDFFYSVSLSAFDLPWVLILAMSFAANWFLAWFKIDMLYDPNKLMTAIIPVVYALGLMLMALTVDGVAELISGFAVFTIGFVLIVSAWKLRPPAGVTA